MVDKVHQFFTSDLWRIRAKRLPRPKYLLIRCLRVIVLSLRQSIQDNLVLRASALTYFSLLSIVPVFAMAFGIAKGFGFEKRLETQLLEKVPNQEEVVMRVIGFAQNALEHTKGGVVAGIGVIVLFYVILKLLGNIEHAFNGIWGVQKPRSLGRKFSDYLSLVMVCPILLISSGSLNVFIVSQVSKLTTENAVLGFFGPAIIPLLALIPYIILWGAFCFIYVYMPNTKVNVVSGLVGGIVAGTAFQMVQWAYIHFQIGAAKMGAIYGSFAALPLFLVWLQVSWIVILFGAHISFAYQNADTFEFEPDCLKASFAFRKLIALRIVKLCIERFTREEPPLSDNQISEYLEAPIRLVRQLLSELVECRILSEIQTKNYKELVYQPGIPLEAITIKRVIDALDHNGSENIPIAQSKELENLKQKVNAFHKESELSSTNIPLVQAEII